MMPKLWSVEAIKNHLIAVQGSIQAGILPELQDAEDERPAPYWQGAEATLIYLSNRFGIDLGSPSSLQSGTGSLRAWDRNDIQSILAEAGTVLKQFPNPNSTKALAYYQGIDQTIMAVALSFRIPSSNSKPNGK